MTRDEALAYARDRCGVKRTNQCGEKPGSTQMPSPFSVMKPVVLRADAAPGLVRREKLW